MGLKLINASVSGIITEISKYFTTNVIWKPLVPAGTQINHSNTEIALWYKTIFVLLQISIIWHKNCGDSIANALEITQPCTTPPVFCMIAKLNCYRTQQYQSPVHQVQYNCISDNLNSQLGHPSNINIWRMDCWRGWKYDLEVSEAVYYVGYLPDMISSCALTSAWLINPDASIFETGCLWC